VRESRPAGHRPGEPADRTASARWRTRPADKPRRVRHRCLPDSRTPAGEAGMTNAATPSTFHASVAVAARDLRLLWRRRGDAAQPVVFALIVITLFPLALGPTPELLSGIAAGVVWVAVLLAGLLS